MFELLSRGKECQEIVCNEKAHWRTHDLRNIYTSNKTYIETSYKQKSYDYDFVV